MKLETILFTLVIGERQFEFDFIGINGEFLLSIYLEKFIDEIILGMQTFFFPIHYWKFKVKD